MSRLRLILILALALRLAYGLAQDAQTPYLEASADSKIYLDIGRYLMTGFDYSKVSLPVAPVYPVFVGLWEILLPPGAAVIIIRILQALMGTAVCYFAYGLARAVARNERAGLLAAGILAVAPVFIIESAQIMTETVYIFLATGGLWAYVSALASPVDKLSRTPWKGLILAGALLGLATLTRAVLLLFPLGLALHLLLICGWRVGLKRAALLLAAYVLAVSTWTAFNLVKWQRLVIGAPGLSATLYIGATGYEGARQVDQNLAQSAGGQLPTDSPNQQKLYQQAAGQIIANDLRGWLAKRAGELAGAVLQPHGTVYFPGASLKDLAVDWLRHDRTLGGLLRLTNGEAFWPKLALYVFHYVALIGGLIGLWLTRWNWRITLALIGFIVYILLVHFVLTALPRYLFPTEVFWWVFAAATLSLIWGRLRTGRPTSHAAELQPVSNQ